MSVCCTVGPIVRHRGQWNVPRYQSIDSRGVGRRLTFDFLLYFDFKKRILFQELVFLHFLSHGRTHRP